MQTHSNRFAFVLDLILVSSLTLVAGLALAGVIHLGIPVGVGTIGNYLIWGSIGLGGAVVLGDFSLFLIKCKWKNLSLNANKKLESEQKSAGLQPPEGISPKAFQKAKKQTLHFPTPILTEEAIEAARQYPSHQILNGLSLGGSKAFVKTTHIPCFEQDKQKSPINTRNPDKIKTVVTVCQLRGMAGDHMELYEKGDHVFQDLFSKHKIQWHYVGKFVSDAATSWEILAHDCTYLDANLNTEDSSNFTVEKLDNFFKAKTEAITNTPVEEWFEPIFQVLDQAVFHGQKVLVHCQAGQSRSATLLAAYFIKRFGMSTEEAIAFLQSKRACVAPTFIKGLQAYASALHDSSSSDSL